jgi:predicted Zn-dependent peptidase
VTYPDRIAAVKPGEVPAAVKQFLDPGRMTIGLLLQQADTAAVKQGKRLSPETR